MAARSSLPAVLTMANEELALALTKAQFDATFWQHATDAALQRATVLLDAVLSARELLRTHLHTPDCACVSCEAIHAELAAPLPTQTLVPGTEALVERFLHDLIALEALGITDDACDA